MAVMLASYEETSVSRIVERQANSGEILSPNFGALPQIQKSGIGG